MVITRADWLWCRKQYSDGRHDTAERKKQCAGLPAYVTGETDGRGISGE